MLSAGVEPTGMILHNVICPVFKLKTHLGGHLHSRVQTTGGAAPPPRTAHHHVQADEGARGKQVRAPVPRARVQDAQPTAAFGQ